MPRSLLLIPLSTLLLSCGATEKYVEVPVQPDRCRFLDPGDMPSLAWDGADPLTLPRADGEQLYVWSEAVSSLRESLALCPYVELVK